MIREERSDAGHRKTLYAVQIAQYIYGYVYSYEETIRNCQYFFAVGKKYLEKGRWEDTEDLTQV